MSIPINASQIWRSDSVALIPFTMTLFGSMTSIAYIGVSYGPFAVCTVTMPTGASPSAVATRSLTTVAFAPVSQSAEHERFFLVLWNALVDSECSKRVSAIDGTLRGNEEIVKRPYHLSIGKGNVPTGIFRQKRIKIGVVPIEVLSQIRLRICHLPPLFVVQRHTTLRRRTLYHNLAVYIGNIFTVRQQQFRL